MIALNGPSEQSVGQITEFQKLFLAPGFLVYASILITAALVIIFYFAPRYALPYSSFSHRPCPAPGVLTLSSCPFRAV